MHVNNEKVKKIAKVAFPDYSGRKFKIEPLNFPIEFSSYWDGGSRNYYVLLRLDNYEILPIENTWSNPFGRVNIPELPYGIILVEHTIFCGKDLGITIFLPKEAFQNFLPVNNDILSLTEKIILIATRSYKSSYAGVSNYRFHEAKRNFPNLTIDSWEENKLRLISKGYLNRAGAITNSGRNLVDNLDFWKLKNEK